MKIGLLHKKAKTTRKMEAYIVCMYIFQRNENDCRDHVCASTYTHKSLTRRQYHARNKNFRVFEVSGCFLMVSWLVGRLWSVGQSSRNFLKSQESYTPYASRIGALINVLREGKGISSYLKL